MKRWRLVLGVAFAAATIAVRPTLAQQDHALVIAAFTYVPGQAGVFGQARQAAVPVIVDRGDTVTATNLDQGAAIGPHTITADQVDPATNVPVFDTRLIGFMESATVSGVQALPPGTYPFHCKVHLFMRGVLVIR